MARHRKNWTQEECDFVISMYLGGATAIECATAVGVKPQDVKNMLYNRGVRRGHRIGEEEIATLRRLYRNTPNDTLAIIVGCSHGHILRLARKLKLKKSPQHLREMHRYVLSCRPGYEHLKFNPQIS